MRTKTKKKDEKYNPNLQPKAFLLLSILFQHVNNCQTKDSLPKLAGKVKKIKSIRMGHFTINLPGNQKGDVRSGTTTKVSLSFSVKVKLSQEKDT